jgi:ParB family chromosome partitioning protein
MEKRLGRGLDSLIPSKAPKAESAPSELPIAQLRPNPFQPRTEFDSEGLEELKESIQRHGLLQPVVVRRVVGGFELVSGERRFRAAKALGLERIPAIVRDSVTDEEMLELALVENLQRRDLDPIEKARGYRGLQERLKLTQDQVAQRVGLNRATVANHLRLLDLPASVQQALAQGKLQMGHARALLGLGSPKDIEALAKTAISDSLSVREVESRVRQSQEPPQVSVVANAVASAQSQTSANPAQSQSSDKPVQAPWARDLERKLTESLGTKVELRERGPFQGTINIHYHNRADLDRLLQRLAPKKLI